MKKTRGMSSFHGRRRALIILVCTGLVTASCTTNNNTIKGNCNAAGAKNSASCTSVQSGGSNATASGGTAEPSPTPAPSTPVAAPESATPAAHPVSEGTPIYQNKEVTINEGYVDVDTYPFLPSQSLGVRVNEGATGLTLNTTGYNRGMRIAVYSLPSQPTRKACITQLGQVAGNMAGMSTRDAAVGKYVCLRTAEKNIAVIQFKIIKNFLKRGTWGPITADITLYKGLFAPLASST